VRLAAADYSFPLLEWRQAAELVKNLGFRGIDISVFEGRSQLPASEILANPSEYGARVRQVLDDIGLEIADVFAIPGSSFEQGAPNDPSALERAKSKDYFYRLLEFTLRGNAKHLTLLPGIHFPQETVADSLKRCAEELELRAVASRELGVRFSIEAHVGSVVSTPALAAKLLDMAPSLTLTLDPSHFVSRGVPDAEILPLATRTSHFHARCGRAGRLQAPLKQNTIPFDSYVKALHAVKYTGWFAVEYVWIDWESCNEVDILSETILMRNLLRTAENDLVNA